VQPVTSTREVNLEGTLVSLGTARTDIGECGEKQILIQSGLRLGFETY